MKYYLTDEKAVIEFYGLAVSKTASKIQTHTDCRPMEADRMEHVKMRARRVSTTKRGVRGFLALGALALAMSMALVSPASATTDVTLFSDETAEVTASHVETTDTNAVTVGVKFTVSEAAALKGVRFYTTVPSTPQIVAVWDEEGNELARVTNYEGGSSAGWTQMNFSTPVSLDADTEYTVGVNALSGQYNVTEDYYSDPVTSDVLSVPADGGVYLYRADDPNDGLIARPVDNWAGSNYLVTPVVTVS